MADESERRVGTTYTSAAVPTAAVLREIQNAQRMLDRHAADLTGMCVSCRVASPCAHREPAVAVFYRYFRVGLPQRRPVRAAGRPSPVDWFRNERVLPDGPWDNRKDAHRAAR